MNVRIAVEGVIDAGAASCCIILETFADSAARLLGEHIERRRNV
jgi:hypothetical protein